MGDVSLADIAAVTDRDRDCFGGGFGGAWIIIILLFLIGGGNWGANRFGNPATVEDLNQTANFTRLESQVARNGQALESNFRTVDNAVCTLGYQNLEQSKDLQAQIADCCCKTQTAIHAEGEATRALIQNNKIEALQQQVNKLQLEQALCGVVRYPNSFVYNAGPSPFCGGYGCGCGCNGGNI